MVAFLEAGVDASYVHILYQRKQDQLFWDFIKLKERYIYFEKDKEKTLLKITIMKGCFQFPNKNVAPINFISIFHFLISILVFYLISYTLLTALL